MREKEKRNKIGKLKCISQGIQNHCRCTGSNKSGKPRKNTKIVQTLCPREKEIYFHQHVKNVGGKILIVLLANSVTKQRAISSHSSNNISKNPFFFNFLYTLIFFSSNQSRLKYSSEIFHRNSTYSSLSPVLNKINKITNLRIINHK